MEQILLENSRLDVEKLKSFVNPNFTEEEIKQIRLGLEKKLDESTFIEPAYSEQLAKFLDSKFNDFQKEEIRKGLENGLTNEQISFYINPFLNSGLLFKFYQQINSEIKNIIISDLKESDIDSVDLDDIELRKDGIYFCDEKLTTMDELLEAHPELQPEPQEQELEQDDTEDHYLEE